MKGDCRVITYETMGPAILQEVVTCKYQKTPYKEYTKNSIKSTKITHTQKFKQTDTIQETRKTKYRTKKKNR